MSAADPALFEGGTWAEALEKYGAVTGLTLSVYGPDGGVVCGPFHPTPLFAFFARQGHDPGILADCARRCLAGTDGRPVVAVAPRYGLAAVGSSLVLEGRTVGAAVAGYAFLDFSRSAAIEQLAREAGLPLRELWDLARTASPITERRLHIQGELLSVLGDAILRENHRTRQYQSTAARLVDESAAKDDFLAMLSHELRTPLTPIRAWARMLKLGAGDPARSLRAAEVIERNAVLQTRLVDDLLELNRVSRGTSVLVLRVHDLADIVRSATEALAPDALAKQIVIDIADHREVLFAEVDRDRMEQIFRNVLANAVKFTPAGGRISVRTSSDAVCATVTIRDSGEGVDPAFLPFAFDQFRQQEQGTRRRHPGLGIGLALVKQLTELHGGGVTIASEGLGHGTEVTVRLPLTSGTGGVQPPLPDDVLPDLGGLHLLVIDDQHDTRIALQLLLEDSGAEVAIAADGAEGLALARRDTFDLILCDLRMPLLDGYEFIAALRRARGTAAPPVIATSGFASSADHVRTEAAGFVGHVDKPFDIRRLAAALKTAVARRAPP